MAMFSNWAIASSLLLVLLSASSSDAFVARNTPATAAAVAFRPRSGQLLIPLSSASDTSSSGESTTETGAFVPAPDAEEEEEGDDDTLEKIESGRKVREVNHSC